MKTAAATIRSTACSCGVRPRHFAKMFGSDVCSGICSPRVLLLLSWFSLRRWVLDGEVAQQMPGPILEGSVAQQNRAAEQPCCKDDTGRLLPDVAIRDDPVRGADAGVREERLQVGVGQELIVGAGDLDVRN